MQFLSRRRRLVAVVSTVAVMGIASLVYAAWTTTGTGNGYAKATSAQNLTTSDISATTSTTLYPSATGNVDIKINNPNSYAVQVTAISANGAATPDASHSSTCTTTGVAFVNQTGLTLNVPASGSTTTTLNNAVTMSNATSNGCQGATFTLPVSITGASN